MQAGIGAQRQRRMCAADLIQRRALVEIFIAIPLTCGNPPGAGRLGDGELCQFILDLDVIQPFLRRDRITETEAIVVKAEHHVHAHAAPLLHEVRRHLGIAVANQSSLAPGLLPGYVLFAALGVLELEIATQRTRIAQQQSQPGRRDHFVAQTIDAIVESPITIHRQRDRQHVARRLQARHVGSSCRQGHGHPRRRHAGGDPSPSKPHAIGALQ